jgi:hypothetical protein
VFRALLTISARAARAARLRSIASRARNVWGCVGDGCFSFHMLGNACGRLLFKTGHSLFQTRPIAVETGQYPTSPCAQIRNKKSKPAGLVGDALDADVRQALAICGGDALAALRITPIANAFLEAEVERLRAEASAGFSRGWVRKAPARKATVQRKEA